MGGWDIWGNLSWGQIWDKWPNSPVEFWLQSTNLTLSPTQTYYSFSHCWGDISNGFDNRFKPNMSNRPFCHNQKNFVTWSTKTQNHLISFGFLGTILFCFGIQAMSIGQLKKWSNLSSITVLKMDITWPQYWNENIKQELKIFNTHINTKTMNSALISNRTWLGCCTYQ